MKRLALSLMLLSFPALADIPPADSVGCREKTAGAACKRDDQSEGTCVTATCSKNDYSGGIPPKTVSYDCLKCGTAVVAPTPAPAPAPAASPCPGREEELVRRGAR